MLYNEQLYKLSLSIIVIEKLAIVRNTFEVETMKNEGNISNKFDDM